MKNAAKKRAIGNLKDRYCLVSLQASIAATEDALHPFRMLFVIHITFNIVTRLTLLYGGFSVVIYYYIIFNKI